MAITNKEILDEIEKLKKKIPTANGDFILLKKTVGDLEIDFLPHVMLLIFEFL